jgi:cytoskeletal protein CcmA (bactofilin family)
MFGFGRSSKNQPRHDAISAFLGAGTQYHGQFNFQGVVRIDGGVIGDIISDGTLVLGEEGYVEGRIRVAELITSGRIVGDVEASQRVVFNTSSNLCGNLTTPIVVIEDGAVINGLVRMAAPQESALSSREAPCALAAGSGEDTPEPLDN